MRRQPLRSSSARLQLAVEAGKTRVRACLTTTLLALLASSFRGRKGRCYDTGPRAAAFWRRVAFAAATFSSTSALLPNLSYKMRRQPLRSSSARLQLAVEAGKTRLRACLTTTADTTCRGRKRRCYDTGSLAAAFWRRAAFAAATFSSTLAILLTLSCRIKKMKKCVCIIVFLCLEGLQAQDLLLDTLLRSYLDRVYAQQSSLRLAAGKDQLLQLSSELKEELFVAEPRIFLRYAPWRVGPPPLQLGLSQQLPLPGQRKQLREQLRAEARESKLWLQQSYELASFLLLQDLYKLYEIEEVQKLEEAQLELLLQRESLAMAQLRTNTETDALHVLDIQVEIEHLRGRLSTLGDQARLLRKSLEQQLQLPSQVIRPPDTLHLPILLRDSLSFKKNSGLLAQKQAEEASEASLRYQRYERWPKLQLQISYLVRETRPLEELKFPDASKGGVMLGVSVRLPILSKRHSLRNELSTQRLKLQKLHSRVYEEALELRAEAAWQQYEEGRRSWQRYERLQALTQETSNLLLASYQSNETSLDNYLQAKIKLLSYRRLQAAALLQACSAAAELFYLQSYRL